MSKLKQTLTIIVCLIVIAAGIFTLVNPEIMTRYKTDTDFEYTEEDGGIVLTKYNGTCENLIVPSEIDSKPVKAIAGAFCNNIIVKNIKISDGIETIDYMAFYGCTSVEKIFIPRSVRSIGHAAFLGCLALETVEGAAGVEEIMPYAFSDCVYLSTLSLSQELLFIGENAFSGCERLEKLMIPASVEVIGGITQSKEDKVIDQRGSTAHTAFDGCEKLSLEIEDGNSWYAVKDGEVIRKVN